MATVRWLVNVKTLMFVHIPEVLLTLKCVIGWIIMVERREKVKVTVESFNFLPVGLCWIVDPRERKGLAHVI